MGANLRSLTANVLICRCNSGENARRQGEDFSKAGHLSIYIPGNDSAWAAVAPRIELAQFRFVCPRCGADRKGGQFFGWSYWPVSKPLTALGKRCYERVCAHQGGLCVTATLTLFCDIVAATRAETRQRAAEEREGRKRAPEDQRAAASGHIEESPARGGGAKSE